MFFIIIFQVCSMNKIFYLITIIIMAGYINHLKKKKCCCAFLTKLEGIL